VLDWRFHPVLRSIMQKRKTTNAVIFHHALAKNASVDDIRAWHKAKGYEDIGYAYVIRKNGSVESGRDVDMVGAHAKFRNSDSIGVCFEGDFRFEEPTFAQIESALNLYRALCEKYGKKLKVEYHRPHIFNIFEPSEYGQFNACPGVMLNREDFSEILGRIII
jgi:hypothetical protein